MMRRLIRRGGLATALAMPGLAGVALARQAEPPAPPPAPAPAIDRTQASQIEPPAHSRKGSPGSAYLDQAGQPALSRDGLTVAPTDQISRAGNSAPASQITARGQGGPGMTQLSAADLDARLAQLSAAERRVLLEAIEGTDICSDPPPIAAIVTLCQNRIETRSREFAAVPERGLSAEERLLRGDFERDMLPSIDQVIERLARSGASTGDFSNQAIASIALGNAPPPTERKREEKVPDSQTMGEEAQAMINALVNQLGGRAP